VEGLLIVLHMLLKILEKQVNIRGYIMCDTRENAFFNYVKGKGKGKAVPLQAWSVPEGSRKLRFPDCTTTAQDGGKVVSLSHRPPLPPGTHLC
jgi:hypothetical protein